MIRALEANDKEWILRILEETNNFNEDEISIALELIDVYLDDEEQTDYIIDVYGNDETGTIEGYICYGKRPLTDKTYDLYWIAVDPKIHGKGIGKKLIQYMEEVIRSRKGNLVLIETSGRAEYEGERLFYKKCGYDVQTVIKDFYRSGDDLFIFRKYLQRADL